MTHIYIYTFIAITYNLGIIWHYSTIQCILSNISNQIDVRVAEVTRLLTSSFVDHIFALLLIIVLLLPL